MRVPTITELNALEKAHNEVVTNDLLGKSRNPFARIFSRPSKEAAPNFLEMISLMFEIDPEKHPEFAKKVILAYEVGKIGKCLHLVRTLKNSFSPNYEVFKDITLGEMDGFNKNTVIGCSGVRYRFDGKIAVWIHGTDTKALGNTDILFDIALAVFELKRMELIVKDTFILINNTYERANS
jgi:hypothetical protein